MTQGLQLRVIVVPVDFSPESERALEYAKELALRSGPAEIVLVHAYYVPPELAAYAPDHVHSYLESLSDPATAHLEKDLVALQDAGITAEYLAERGSHDEVIVGIAAGRKADLIVMGTHGRTGITRVALGSIAERVVQTAHCPVLTVKKAGK